MYLAAIDGINLTHLPRDADGQFISYNRNRPLVIAPGNRADVFFMPSETGDSALMMSGHLSLEDLGIDIEPLIGAGPAHFRQPFTQELMIFDIAAPTQQTISSSQDLAEVEMTFLTALDENLLRLQQTAPYRGHLRPFAKPIEIQRVITFDMAPGKSGRLPPPSGVRDRVFQINGRDYNAINEGEELSHHTMQGMNDYLGKFPQDGGRGPDGQTPWPMRAKTEESILLSSNG